jgi:hypothetical protein
LRVADAAALAAGGFFTAGFPASGLVAVAFDAAATRVAGFARPAAFDCFDGALRDAPPVVFPGCLLAFLPVFFAVAWRVFEGGAFADVVD